MNFYKQIKGLPMGYICGPMVANLYVYIGGLFEWLLLQDIYGDEEFPTTSKIIDILKYKGTSNTSHIGNKNNVIYNKY